MSTVARVAVWVLAGIGAAWLLLTGATLWALLTAARRDARAARAARWTVDDDRRLREWADG